jgi:hypothetical protein
MVWQFFSFLKSKLLASNILQNDLFKKPFQAKSKEVKKEKGFSEN